MKLIDLKQHSLCYVMLFLFFTASFCSCKKADVKPSENVVERFLKLPANASPQLIRVTEDLRKKEKEHPFIEQFVATVGYPLWEYAKIAKPKTKNNFLAREDGEPEEIMEVPVVPNLAEYVNGILKIKLDVEILYKLLERTAYESYGFDKDPNRATLNADDLVKKIMSFEKLIWSQDVYQIKDNRLFDYWPAGFTKPGSFYMRSTITIDGIIIITVYGDCPELPHGEVVGVAPGESIDDTPIDKKCPLWTIIIEDEPWDGGGGGGDDGGWGGSPGPGGVGGIAAWSGNGGGGGSSSGTPEEPCNPDFKWIRLEVRNSQLFNPCLQQVINISAPNFIPDSYAEFGNLDQPDNTPDKAIIDNGITVEDTQDPQQQQSNHLLGKTTDRQNTEDLEYGTNDNFTGLDLTDFDESNDGLFGIMTELFDFCSTYDLEDVGHDMIGKFRTNTTVDYYYSDNRLNQAVRNSSDLINFLKEFGKALVPEVQRLGNVVSVPTIEMEETRPVFNGAYNKFNGLQILINDTELTEIRYINSRNSGNQWEVEVEVTIYDHFGLDRADAIAYQIYHRGFPAWWMLQHLRNFVPYKTKVVVYKTLKFSI